MATKQIEVPWNRSQIQLYYPKISHNGFGYCLMLKTGLTIGKRAFAFEILGLGFGFCYDLPGTLYGMPKGGWPEPDYKQKLEELK
jgi:hypothetical protein